MRFLDLHIFLHCSSSITNEVERKWLFDRHWWREFDRLAVAIGVGSIDHRRMYIKIRQACGVCTFSIVRWHCLFCTTLYAISP